MTDLLTKAQALEVLQERTGRKFSKGIFSANLRRDRIWSRCGRVWASDIDRFIADREKRRAEPVDTKIRRRLNSILIDLCRNDTTLENMLKLVDENTDAAKHLRGARQGITWAVMGLLEATRALRAMDAPSVE
jgi:hypothetical protein